MNLTNVTLTTGGGLYHGDAHDAEDINSAGPLLMKYTQVEPGPFLSRGSLLMLPNITAGFGALNRGTVARGTVLQDHICVFGSESPGLSLDFDRQTLQPRVLAVTSPNCEVELYSRHGRRGFLIAIWPEAWRHSASALDIASVPSSGADIKTKTVGQWAFLLHRLNWINAAIRAYPESFEQPQVRREVEQDLIELLIAVSAARQSKEPRRESIPARQHALRRVRDHLHEHMVWPLTLTDLCTAAGLGARSLQIAFPEKLQVSPMQYVRAELLACAAPGKSLRQRFGCRPPERLLAHGPCLRQITEGCFEKHRRKPFGVAESGSSLPGRLLRVQLGETPSTPMLSMRTNRDVSRSGMPGSVSLLPALRPHDKPMFPEIPHAPTAVPRLQRNPCLGNTTA